MQGYNFDHSNVSAFVPNPAFLNTDEIKEFIPSFSTQSTLLAQPSISTVPTPVSVQSIGIDVAVSQENVIDDERNSDKKKSRKKKAASPPVGKENSDVEVKSSTEKKTIVNPTAGKKTKASSQPKLNTPEKADQAKTANSAKTKNSPVREPNRNVLKENNVAGLPSAKLQRNAETPSPVTTKASKEKSSPQNIAATTRTATTKGLKENNDTNTNIFFQESAFSPPTNAMSEKNLASPSKKKARKRKKKTSGNHAITPTEELKNVTEANSFMEQNRKDILIKSLNGQKLHVNLLFLLSQLQSNNFQNVQDMLAYLEKENDFLVSDCWVECC